MTVPMNSDLSARGHAMVSRLNAILREQDFLVRNAVQLIVHSPLVRAQKTCIGIFGGNNPINVPIIQHENLYEQNVNETLGLADMNSRIAGVTAWLQQREERRICIVGHSAFFRTMVAPADVRWSNCGVWQVELRGDGTYANARLVVEGGDALLGGD
jgi:phosphohistidine phosphatase SixA